MRIIIDLDGTICELRKDPENYSDVRVISGAPEKIRQFKQDGHYIIIHTARHMKTCKGDVNKVVEKMRPVTKAWLSKHNIPYDELIFGKPYGDLYIDDLAHKFTSWEEVILKEKSSDAKKDKDYDS